MRKLRRSKLRKLGRLKTRGVYGIYTRHNGEKKMQMQMQEGPSRAD